MVTQWATQPSLKAATGSSKPQPAVTHKVTLVVRQVWATNGKLVIHLKTEPSVQTGGFFVGYGFTGRLLSQLNRCERPVKQYHH